MFSEGGTVLKEKYANAEDQTGLPSGAGEGEDTRKASEYEARNREVFEDDGQLDSSAAQNADAMMEVAGILAGGNLDDLSEEDLAKIKNPALRAQLQGKALEAKQAAELKAHQEMWDRQMHRIGDAEYSGAQLHSMHEYLKDDKNADAFEKELMAREGISREEAKKRRMNVQEYLEIAEKRRSGQTLSTEEERRERELQKDPHSGKDFRTLNEMGVKTEANDYGYTGGSKQTGQMQQKVDGGPQLSTFNREATTRQIIGSGFVDTVKPPPRPDYSDVETPLIKAEPLRPAFQRAESSVIPLDAGIEKKPTSAPVIVASAPVLQAEGATF
jgi:hypothetical protein